MTKDIWKKTGIALCGLALSVTATLAPHKASADSELFIGEIMATGVSGFCPRGTAPAEGQLLPISSNQALFSLLGTTYGGDGRTNFALPDLRGRTPVGVGNGNGLLPVSQGEKRGAEQVTLTTANLAQHNHMVQANNLDGDKPGPGGKLLAAAPTSGTGTETIYSLEPANVEMSAEMISSSGQNQPLDILDPTLVIRYCIAIQGIFPPRN